MLDDFEQTMLSYLITGSTSLYALTSNRVRPYPMKKDETFPCIVYQKVPGGEHITTHGGHSGLIKNRYQFNVWGSTHLQVRSAADALISTLGHWTGTNSYVLDCFDDYEPDTQLHRVIVDAEIWRKP